MVASRDRNPRVHVRKCIVGHCHVPRTLACHVADANHLFGFQHQDLDQADDSAVCYISLSERCFEGRLEEEVGPDTVGSDTDAVGDIGRSDNQLVE